MVEQPMVYLPKGYYVAIQKNENYLYIWSDCQEILLSEKSKVQSSICVCHTHTHTDI